MGNFLTTASLLQCPHGGIVTATTTNVTATAGGDFIVRSSDTFLVAGCIFTLPSGTPHPCLTVQWLVSALTNQVMGDSVLTTDSSGLCLAPDQTPQGPVIIGSTQLPVSGL